ncbi:MAG: diguanylate cyclase [Chloroflexota bacterium]
MKVIAIIGGRESLEIASLGLIDERYSLMPLKSIGELFEVSFSSPPDLILFRADDLAGPAEEALSNIKADPLCAHIPMVAMTRDTAALKAPGLKGLIDDFLLLPPGEDELLVRIELNMERSRKTFELNPLTRLPGNITIIKEIQRWIDAERVFALAHVDIDFFKPFNDRYGFTRGDEVIRMLGRLITNILKLKVQEACFVGHVGGDDFVFLVPFEKAEEACGDLIGHFAAIIPSFYDAEDRRNGYVESVSRDGVPRRFPFVSLSIGVAHNGYRKLSHYGKFSETASEMKKFAKKTAGNCYRIDRRKS